MAAKRKSKQRYWVEIRKIWPGHLETRWNKKEVKFRQASCYGIDGLAENRLFMDFKCVEGWDRFRTGWRKVCDFVNI